MAVNQKLENTSNACTRSSHGPSTGCCTRYSSTLLALRLRCGSSAPGTAPNASRNSSTSAVPIDVKLRQVLRITASPTMARRLCGFIRPPRPVADQTAQSWPGVGLLAAVG
ncbi:hypothetical protein C1Y40_05192 [Mycobacterium talmoniae]|uniref:Uncharacterized protein n=1 Tax=Mycobacterium talmoniae TaxID=1858794 RepID=A0A2S8BDD2_9MYCO|nr:hypothetical protein C1Y40_05192 [Mycobacterium talmoniae]